MFLDYMLDICFTMVCYSFQEWSIMSQVSKHWYQRSHQRICYENIVCRHIPTSISTSNAHFIEKLSYNKRIKTRKYECSLTNFIFKLSQLQSLKIDMSVSIEFVVFNPLTNPHLKYLELTHSFLSKTEIELMGTVLSLEVIILRDVTGVSSCFLDMLSHLPKFTTLFLERTNIKTDKLFEQTTYDMWPNLSTLIVYQSKITKHDLKFLCQAKKLKYLFVHYTCITFTYDDEITLQDLQLTTLEYLFLHTHLMSQTFTCENSCANWTQFQLLEGLWMNTDNPRIIEMLLNILNQLFPNMLSVAPDGDFLLTALQNLFS